MNSQLQQFLAEAFTQELTKETEIYQGVRQQLQDMGLLGVTEHHHRFTEWMQSHLKSLFSDRLSVAKQKVKR